MLTNPVLAFIKAFRLCMHDSIDKLKHSALSKFDCMLMVSAQKAIWDCNDVAESLSDAGISLHVRRGSDKRSQAAAILDDLLVAFDKLDELDNIPDIFCEANDLIKLPPVSSDTSNPNPNPNHVSLVEIEKHM